MAPPFQINIRKQSRGRFIVLEGIDGAGKTTLQRSLGEALARRQIEVLMLREPGSTSLGEQVRQLLKQLASVSERPTAESEVLLMYAARSQLLAQVIKPQLALGKWIICDRYNLSSIIYQGIGRGLALDHIYYLNQWIVNNSVPDITFLLDLPAEKAWERMQQRKHLDRVEREGLSFFQTLRCSYLNAALVDRSIHVLDAQKPQQELKNQALSVLSAWITEWSASS